METFEKHLAQGGSIGANLPDAEIETGDITFGKTTLGKTQPSSVRRKLKIWGVTGEGQDLMRLSTVPLGKEIVCATE